MMMFQRDVNVLNTDKLIERLSGKGGYLAFHHNTKLETFADSEMVSYLMILLTSLCHRRFSTTLRSRSYLGIGKFNMDPASDKALQPKWSYTGEDFQLDMIPLGDGNGYSVNVKSDQAGLGRTEDDKSFVVLSLATVTPSFYLIDTHTSHQPHLEGNRPKLELKLILECETGLHGSKLVNVSIGTNMAEAVDMNAFAEEVGEGIKELSTLYENMYLLANPKTHAAMAHA
jgi:hypothetical protein